MKLRCSDYLKFFVLLAALFSIYLYAAPAKAASNAPASTPDAVIVEKDRGLLDLTHDYIEAEGVGGSPSCVKDAQGKALARRAAIVDLQRNLLEFMNGVRIDARTTVENFMADDRVRTELSGIIKNVELLDGEWDGESYTIRGRVRMGQIRVVVAPSIPQPQPYPVRSDAGCNDHAGARTPGTETGTSQETSAAALHRPCNRRPSSSLHALHDVSGVRRERALGIRHKQRLYGTLQHVRALRLFQQYRDCQGRPASDDKPDHGQGG